MLEEVRDWVWRCLPYVRAVQTVVVVMVMEKKRKRGTVRGIGIVCVCVFSGSGRNVGVKSGGQMGKERETDKWSG